MGASAKLTGITVSLYWASLTVGRLLAGVISKRFSNVQILRGGAALVTLGIVIMTATRNAYVAVVAFTFIGLGLAPVFPLMVHEIPRRVGDAASERSIGIMLGANYLGGATLPSLMGFFAAHTSILIMGPMMLIMVVLMAASQEVSAYNAIYKKAKRR
jgi:fucose permease